MGLFKKTVNDAVSTATDTVAEKVSKTIEKTKDDILPVVKAVSSLIPFVVFFFPVIRGKGGLEGVHIHDCTSCNITIYKK